MGLPRPPAAVVRAQLVGQAEAVDFIAHVAEQPVPMRFARSLAVGLDFAPPGFFSQHVVFVAVIMQQPRNQQQARGAQ